MNKQSRHLDEYFHAAKNELSAENSHAPNRSELAHILERGQKQQQKHDAPHSAPNKGLLGTILEELTSRMNTLFAAPVWRFALAFCFIVGALGLWFIISSKPKAAPLLVSEASQRIIPEAPTLTLDMTNAMTKATNNFISRTTTSNQEKPDFMRPRMLNVPRQQMQQPHSTILETAEEMSIVFHEREYLYGAESWSVVVGDVLSQKPLNAHTTSLESICIRCDLEAEILTPTPYLLGAEPASLFRY